MLGRIGRTSFDGSSTSVSRGAGQRGAALGAGQGGRTATGQARAPKRLTAQSAVLTHAEIVTDAAGLDFQDGQARAPSGWRPLMEALYRLLDPSIPVDLPVLAPNQRLPPLDNRDLDKLFTALGAASPRGAAPSSFTSGSSRWATAPTTGYVRRSSACALHTVRQAQPSGFTTGCVRQRRTVAVACEQLSTPTQQPCALPWLAG